jgi:hypothetical protein
MQKSVLPPSDEIEENTLSEIYSLSPPTPQREEKPSTAWNEPEQNSDTALTKAKGMSKKKFIKLEARKKRAVAKKRALLVKKRVLQSRARKKKSAPAHEEAFLVSEDSEILEALPAEKEEAAVAPRRKVLLAWEEPRLDADMSLQEVPIAKMESPRIKKTDPIEDRAAAWEEPEWDAGIAFEEVAIAAPETPRPQEAISPQQAPAAWNELSWDDSLALQEISIAKMGPPQHKKTLPMQKTPIAWKEPDFDTAVAIEEVAMAAPEAPLPPEAIPTQQTPVVWNEPAWDDSLALEEIAIVTMESPRVKKSIPVKRNRLVWKEPKLDVGMVFQEIPLVAMELAVSSEAALAPEAPLVWNEPEWDDSLALTECAIAEAELSQLNRSIPVKQAPSVWKESKLDVGMIFQEIALAEIEPPITPELVLAPETPLVWNEPKWDNEMALGEVTFIATEAPVSEEKLPVQELELDLNAFKDVLLTFAQSVVVEQYVLNEGPPVWKDLDVNLEGIDCIEMPSLALAEPVFVPETPLVWNEPRLDDAWGMESMAFLDEELPLSEVPVFIADPVRIVWQEQEFEPGLGLGEIVSAEKMETPLLARALPQLENLVVWKESAPHMDLWIEEIALLEKMENPVFSRAIAVMEDQIVWNELQPIAEMELKEIALAEEAKLPLFSDKLLIPEEEPRALRDPECNGTENLAFAEEVGEEGWDEPLPRRRIASQNQSCEETVEPEQLVHQAGKKSKRDSTLPQGQRATSLASNDAAKSAAYQQEFYHCCKPSCVPDCCCDSRPWPKRVTIKHVWGDQESTCLPFATNYTTLNLLFAPDYRLGSVLPMLDLEVHRFDNNTYAANGGVGGRYIPNPSCDCFCEILGFNAYYDYRQGCIGYYQQVGAGIEILGSRWDFRANAYAPFGNRRHTNTCVFDDYDGDYYAIKSNIESVSYSFNAEIGYLLYDSCTFLFYAAGGPYFLATDVCYGGFVGGEVRIRPQYKDYVALDLSWRYDDLFETIWQIEIIFSLPLYQISGRNKYPCCITDRQIYQPIERFEVMPLSKRTCWQTNF